MPSHQQSPPPTVAVAAQLSASDTGTFGVVKAATPPLCFPGGSHQPQQVQRQQPSGEDGEADAEDMEELLRLLLKYPPAQVEKLSVYVHMRESVACLLSCGGVAL